MQTIFSSLAIANYRRYFTGALFSNIGSWMGRTAVSWLVLMELTDGSASALGFVTAIMFLPGLQFMPAVWDWIAWAAMILCFVLTVLTGLDYLREASKMRQTYLADHPEEARTKE